MITVLHMMNFPKILHGSWRGSTVTDLPLIPNKGCAASVVPLSKSTTSTYTPLPSYPRLPTSSNLPLFVKVPSALQPEIFKENEGQRGRQGCGTSSRRYIMAMAKGFLLAEIPCELPRGVLVESLPTSKS